MPGNTWNCQCVRSSAVIFPCTWGCLAPIICKCLSPLYKITLYSDLKFPHLYEISKNTGNTKCKVEEKVVPWYVENNDKKKVYISSSGVQLISPNIFVSDCANHRCKTHLERQACNKFHCVKISRNLIRFLNILLLIFIYAVCEKTDKVLGIFVLLDLTHLPIKCHLSKMSFLCLTHH